MDSAVRIRETQGAIARAQRNQARKRWARKHIRILNGPGTAHSGVVLCLVSDQRGYELDDAADREKADWYGGELRRTGDATS